MYLVMTPKKPSESTKFKARNALNGAEPLNDYDGDSTHQIAQNFETETDDTVIVTADSRLLLFVGTIIPLENTFLYNGNHSPETNGLLTLANCTDRNLKPGHNLFKLYEAGEFNRKNS